MEITEINMITNFEAGMNCLQNPSLISFPNIQKVPQIYNFWKWGALIFAIFATFSSIIKRIKLLLIRFHTVKPFSPQYELITDFSEDDDVSLASSDNDFEEEEEEEIEEENSPTTSFRCRNSDFCFRNQWSEFTSGKNVVKLWDSLGLSLDFDEDLINNSDSSSVVSMWDFDRSEYSGEGSPAMVMTAERNGKGDGVVLGGYDSRMRRRFPALFAEWRSPAAAVDGVVLGGGGKVYVRNEMNGVLTVGDVRNMRMPLETNGDTWWDADAVIVGEEFDESS